MATKEEAGFWERFDRALKLKGDGRLPPARREQVLQDALFGLGGNEVKKLNAIQTKDPGYIDITNWTEEEIAKLRRQNT